MTEVGDSCSDAAVKDSGCKEFKESNKYYPSDVSKHLIVPYCIKNGIIKKPHRRIVTWKTIFSYVFGYDEEYQQTYLFDINQFRSSCRLFRDAIKPPHILWTSFPHPMYGSLTALMDVLTLTTTKAPKSLLIKGNSIKVESCRQDRNLIELLNLDDCDMNRTMESTKHTPLYYACREGLVGVVRLLLSIDIVDVNLSRIDNGNTPLFIACDKNHYDIICLLLQDDKINVNLSRNTGATPLWWASNKGNYDIVCLLLQDDKIDVNQPDNKGTTPLCRACLNGHIEIVRMLLQQPTIDVNQPRTDERNRSFTPLCYSCNYRNVEIVRMLLQHPTINVNRSMLSGLNLATHYAKGNIRIVELLLEHRNINVNQIRRDDGSTVLCLACKKGDIEFIRKLLSHPNIDISKKTYDGHSPLSIAKERDHIELIQLLSEALENEVRRMKTEVHQMRKNFARIWQDCTKQISRLSDELTVSQEETIESERQLRLAQNEARVWHDCSIQISRLSKQMNDLLSKTKNELTASQEDVQNLKKSRREETLESERQLRLAQNRINSIKFDVNFVQNLRRTERAESERQLRLAQNRIDSISTLTNGHLLHVQNLRRTERAESERQLSLAQDEARTACSCVIS